MVYGVKVIHTYEIGEDKRRFYEEVILRVKAESYEDAYRKAECYMQDYICAYTNPMDAPVKTLRMEIIDCFLTYESEGDVQEMYSSVSQNQSSLAEESYYRAITSVCDKADLIPLRNKEFN